MDDVECSVEAWKKLSSNAYNICRHVAFICLSSTFAVLAELHVPSFKREVPLVPALGGNVAHSLVGHMHISPVQRKRKTLKPDLERWRLFWFWDNRIFYDVMEPLGIWGQK